jgi:hypothetical protein
MGVAGMGRSNRIAHFERPADADCDCLLAEIHVRESGVLELGRVGLRHPQDAVTRHLPIHPNICIEFVLA